MRRSTGYAIGFAVAAGILFIQNWMILNQLHELNQRLSGSQSALQALSNEIGSVKQQVCKTKSAVGTVLRIDALKDCNAK